MSGREPTLRDALLAELAAEGEDDLESAGMLALLADVVAPTPGLRDRIAATVRTAHRFDDLEEALAGLVDLPIDEVRALLLAIDGPAVDGGGQWVPGPAPGIELLHFRGGPAVRDAVTGFVRLPRDVEFPEHGHVGDEVVMILQGAYRDSSGAVHGRGEIVRMPAGTEHSLVAVGPVPLCYAAVVHRGVRFGDEVMTPDDPRA